MNKISCNIIKDLLPLYIENVVSDETRILVSEHLLECDVCRNDLKNMQLPMDLIIDTDTNALNSIKNKLFFRKIFISIVTSVIMIFLFILGVSIYQLEIPVKYSEIKMDTEEVTMQNGIKVFQVKVIGNNLELVEVLSDYKDNNDMLHYKIVRTTFLRHIFSSHTSSVSVSVAEYWNEIDSFKSTLVIEFEDNTIIYKNGIQVNK